MSEQKMQDLIDELIEFIRTRFEDEIDEAYEYFWEEEYPDEFLSGNPLVLAFHNFEDWLLFDYRPKNNEMGGMVQRYIEFSEPDAETAALLKAMDASTVRLYEIMSNDNGNVKLADLSLGGGFTLTDERFKDVDAGSVFATRFVDHGGAMRMTRSFYPFGTRLKGRVLESIGKMYQRYSKHNDAPDMEKFLKAEAYSFNTIWISSLHKSS